jgi:hypothetical protein
MTTTPHSELPPVPGAAEKEVGVPVFDDEPVPAGEVCEQMFTYDEAIAFLDREAPDWRLYNRHPPPFTVHVFGARLWSETELRAWIGK